MKIVTAIARTLLGLMFLIFGLNGFLQFIPAPMPTGLAGQYMTVIFVSHYAYLIFAAQILGGVLLLANRFVPLGLTILAGVLLNILAYHLAMDLKGLPPGIVAVILWFIVFSSVRSSFSGIFAARTGT